jgi:hypothetical protein
VARVVMSDAIKQFASTLLQARPVWRVDNVHDVADRIINPRSPEQLQAQAAEQILPAQTPESAAPSSRAKAIFDAAENAASFNPEELEFAFDDAETHQGVPAHLKETSPAQPLPRKTGSQKRKILGMTVPQFALLAGMVIVEFCMIAIFGVVFILTR